MVLGAIVKGFNAFGGFCITCGAVVTLVMKGQMVPVAGRPDGRVCQPDPLLAPPRVGSVRSQNIYTYRKKENYHASVQSNLQITVKLNN